MISTFTNHDESVCIFQHLMEYVLYSLRSLLSAVIFIAPYSSTTPECNVDIYFKGCCPEYTWNDESQKCEKCLPGYGGLNCSWSCPYPYYGVNCQKECNCTEEDCDVSRGCPAVSTLTEEVTTIPIVTSTVLENLTNLTSISTYTNDTTNVPAENSFSINTIIFILIKVIGFVDMVMIVTYVAVCIYDRKYNAFNTREMPDTNAGFSENNSMYENVQIIFSTD